MPTVSSPNSAFAYNYATNLNENGSVQVVRNTLSNVNWTDSVTRGQNIPGWRQLIRQGSDATTSLIGTKVSVRVKNGRTTVQKPKLGIPGAAYLTTVVGAHNISLSPHALDPSGISATKANNAALRKFVSRLQEVNTAVQGGVILGELAQTLRSIKSPAQSLRKLVTDWRATGVNLRRTARFRPLPVRRRLVQDALADSWLETQFHWIPLLRDIDDGCRALAEINTGQALVAARVTAKGQAQDNPTETFGSNGDGLAGWETRVVVVEDVIVIYRGAMRVNARDSLLMRPELLGFNPASWVPTAWELVPYSFLIDYFTNIGDILAGWSMCRNDLSWCNRTIRRTYSKASYTKTSLSYVKLNYTPTATSCTSSAAQVIANKTSVERSKYSGNFIPSFEFEIPGMGSKRWLNIAALIASRESDRKFSLGD